MTEQPQPAPPPVQLSLGKVATPDGERLTIGVALLLDVTQARELAAQIAQLADSMPASGLVIARGLMTG